MLFQPGTHEDMAYLLKHLSPLHQHELEMCALANGVSGQTVIDMLAAWVDLVGIWVAKDAKGRVLVVYSIRPMDAGKSGIWLFCTKWFFKDLRNGMRELKKLSDQLIAEQRAKMKVLQTLTFSQHRNAEKWARMLGFDHVVEVPPYGRLFTRTK